MVLICDTCFRPTSRFSITGTLLIHRCSLKHSTAEIRTFFVPHQDFRSQGRYKYIRVGSLSLLPTEALLSRILLRDLLWLRFGGEGVFR